MMMVTLLNTMMLITKVLLAAKNRLQLVCFYPAAISSCRGHHLTLVLVSMVMMIAMMTMMAIVP